MYWFRLPITNHKVRHNDELFFECLAYKKQRIGLVKNIQGPTHYTFIFFYEQLSIGNGVLTSIYPPNSFIILKPLQQRHYGDASFEWTHSWFSFGGTFAEKLIKENNIPIGIVQRLDSPYLTEKYILQLYNEIFESIEANHTIIKNIFHNFIIELNRAINLQNHPSLIPQAIQQVKNYIELNYSKKVTLESLCKLANFSKTKVTNLFREYFSITPIEYLLHLRLEEAKSLLIDINLSIKDVAQEVGYDDIYYFSRLFKKRFGKSPTEYRKSQTSSLEIMSIND